MSDPKKDFAKRLKAAMEEAGYPARPVVLEREFNLRFAGEPMSPQGVRRWLEGETLPTRAKLEVLAEWLKVTPEGLAPGVVTDEEVRANRVQVAMTGADSEVLEAYLSLRPQQKRVVREVILTFAKVRG